MYNHQRIGTRSKGLGNKRTSWDHPKYSIEIGQNPKKSPGDLRRLSVTPTPVENHQLTWVWKTRKSIKQETTGWTKCSSKNCARNLNVTIRTNGICTGERDAQTSQGFWDIYESPNLGLTNRPYHFQPPPQKKNKRTRRIVDFADHKVKLKETEKKDKYLDLPRELKKLRNMKVTIIPIVTGALGTVTKGLIQGLEDLEIRGRVETVLRSVRILKRALETWGDLMSLRLQWKAISVKNSPEVNNNNNNNDNNNPG